MKKALPLALMLLVLAASPVLAQAPAPWSVPLTNFTSWVQSSIPFIGAIALILAVIAGPFIGWGKAGIGFVGVLFVTAIASRADTLVALVM